jgi:hypothetical protein
MTACPTFAFRLQVVLQPAENEETGTRFRAALDAALGARGLIASGVIGVTGGMLMIRGDGAQTTDADRAFVRAWLAEQSGVGSAAVGELLDLSSDL